MSTKVIISYGGTVLVPLLIWMCSVWLVLAVWFARLAPFRHLPQLAKWCVAGFWLVHFAISYYTVFKLLDFAFRMSLEMSVGQARGELGAHIQSAAGMFFCASFGLVLLTLYRVRERTVRAVKTPGGNLAS